MTIGHISFPVYSVSIMASVFIGTIYIYYSLRKKRINKQYIMLYMILYIPSAFIFGKLFTIAAGNSDNLLTAGLSSYGGLLGTTLSALFFDKLISAKGIIIRYTVLALPLIYGISKIGCTFAGCCYGIPYNGPFAVTYLEGAGIPVFPVQATETIVFLILFIILQSFRNRKNITPVAMICIVTCKFMLDFLRYEHIDTTLTFNQKFSIIEAVVSIIILMKKN